MENQTFGGVSPIDFIKSNFEGAFDIKRLEEINCSLGKALMVVRRGSMLDMPDIGSIAGREPKSESNVGILIKLGAPEDSPQTPSKPHKNCDTCEKVESMPYCLPGHYCDGYGKAVNDFTQEEELFRAIAKSHFSGRLTVVGGKQMDATRFYQALGHVSESWAETFKLVSVEMMYLYDSFPQGVQPETGFATERVVRRDDASNVIRRFKAKHKHVTPEALQEEIDAIYGEE